MATMDGWWDGERRAGRPDPACRRVRPTARRQRRRASPTTATSPRTTMRASPPPSTLLRRGARWSSSRAPGRSSRRRTARPPSRRSRTRPWRPAGPATSCRARSARSSPRASSRSPPRGSASTSTGWRATSGGERFGDAGLLASDLPDGLAIARKRLAAVAERRTAGKRLGFARAGSSETARDAGRQPERRPARRD